VTRIVSMSRQTGEVGLFFLKGKRTWWGVAEDGGRGGYAGLSVIGDTDDLSEGRKAYLLSRDTASKRN